METACFHKLMQRVSYKPGWRFTLRPAAGSLFTLEVSADVLDSWSPQVQRTIAMNYAFERDECGNAGRFYAFVRASMLRTELHECNEWFRVNGTAWPTSDHTTF